MRPASTGAPAGPRLAGRLGLTRGAIAAIAAISSAGVAASLMPPLVSLNLAERGVSERTIGLLIATVAVSALIITPLASRLVARFGTAQLIATCVLGCATAFPALWVFQSLYVLFPLVFVYGAGLTVCFVLSEFWINAVTPDHRRGLVMGIYATVLSLGFALGPIIVALAGYTSVRPFLLGSAIMAVAAVPALAARSASPNFKDAPKQRFLAFIFAVPVATFGVFVFAMKEQSGFAFLPLWGIQLGFDPALAVLLASAMTLGNVVFQVPIGLLADRYDRRALLLSCGLIGMVGMIAAWAVSDSFALLMAVVFVWGGGAAGLYTVGLAHLASRFTGGALASANAAFVFCYALGMLAGPVIVGDAMARAPAFGFPLVLGSAFAIYVAVVAVRIVARPMR